MLAPRSYLSRPPSLCPLSATVSRGCVQNKRAWGKSSFTSRSLLNTHGARSIIVSEQTREGTRGSGRPSRGAAGGRDAAGGRGRPGCCRGTGQGRDAAGGRGKAGMLWGMGKAWMRLGDGGRLGCCRAHGGGKHAGATAVRKSESRDLLLYTDPGNSCNTGESPQAPSE